jgi:hypothetical protein
LARSAQIGGPNGIASVFQVSANSTEPFKSVTARNLLSKDNWRTALGDETMEGWPEVPPVSVAFSETDDRKRLTGAWTGPDGFVVTPSSETQGVGPSSDSSEEMDLREPFEIGGLNINDAPFVHEAVSDQLGRDEVAQPSRQEGVIFVVVGAHFALRPLPAPVVRKQFLGTIYRWASAAQTLPNENSYARLKRRIVSAMEKSFL